MPEMMTAPVGEAAQALITPRVLVFFDYACQFCYLDWPRFKRLREEHAADLFLVPYELRPAMPAEGVSLDELGGGHSEHVEEHMLKMAREAALPLVFPRHVPNTHYALALGEYARDVGPEAHEAIHEAIFEAYSGHGRDIGSASVILDIAETHALDRDDVEDALLSGRYDERLHQFLHLGLSFGVTATPSALICNELFIGSRPYRVLEESLERCLVRPETIESQGAEGSEGETPAHAAGHRAGEPREGDAPSIDH